MLIVYTEKKEDIFTATNIPSIVVLSWHNPHGADRGRA